MSENYEHKWEITVLADDLQGARDAVWAMWTAWRDGKEPISGSGPASRGSRMSYRVRKVDPANPLKTVEASAPGDDRPRCPHCHARMVFCDDRDGEGNRTQPDWWNCEGCGHNEPAGSKPPGN